jgi:hypothetical protein
MLFSGKEASTQMISHLNMTLALAIVLIDRIAELLPLLLK